MRFFLHVFSSVFFQIYFDMKVQGDRGFCALSGYVLSFVMTRFYLRRIEKLMKTERQKFEKNEGKNAFLGNIMMRVPLLCLNLFLADKCNSKCLYIEL